METKKIIFISKSLYGTPLHSDTLFGHICWAVRYKKGESVLKEMLNKFNSGNPPFLISSAFPENYIFRPLIPMSEIVYDKNKPKTAKEKKNMESLKKNKKLEYVLISDIIKFQKDYKSNNIFTDISDEALSDIKIQEYPVTRNMINRNTLTVEEGHLWTDSYYFCNSEKPLNAYLKVMDDKYNDDFFKEVFEYLSQVGIGKDKSVGKGKFDISLHNLNEDENKLLNYRGTHFVSLSHCAGSNLTPLSYNVFIKYGKVSEDFSSKGLYYKKPIAFYKHGAVFKFDNTINIYGTMVKGIHTNNDIVQYGYSFPLFIDYKETI